MAKRKKSKKIKRVNRATKAITTIQDEKILADFLKLNGCIELVREKDRTILKKLWNDESVGIQLPAKKEDLKELGRLLKDIFLPPAFSAIYHENSKKVELIFTVFPIGKLSSRKFNFTFKERGYTCYFGDSSEVLLKIAECFYPAHTRTATNYRNVQDFNFYVKDKENDLAKKAGLRPSSFWIEGIEAWKSDDIIDLAKHINFYMTYFDSDTPVIDIHEDLPQQTTTKKLSSLFETFPENINAHKIDETLLGLSATESRTTNPFLKYLYLYQMIEYSAFYFRPEEIEQKLRRILLAPHSANYITSAINEIMDIAAQTKGNSDDTKIDALVSYYSDPALLWKVISHYKSNFSNLQEFDGGFKLEALIRDDWDINDLTNVIPLISPQLRKIRNALSHSREMRSHTSISPTKQNAAKLTPWVALINVIANQITAGRG